MCARGWVRPLLVHLPGVRGIPARPGGRVCDGQARAVLAGSWLTQEVKDQDALEQHALLQSIFVQHPTGRAVCCSFYAAVHATLSKRPALLKYSCMSLTHKAVSAGQEFVEFLEELVAKSMDGTPAPICVAVPDTWDTNAGELGSYLACLSFRPVLAGLWLQEEVKHQLGEQAFGQDALLQSLLAQHPTGRAMCCSIFWCHHLDLKCSCIRKPADR